ncbi:MAG: leucine-rich repeat domain-containing protein [Ruminococcaceae bacterium]|nr:leucine-rich repeat domain-containing protein [Oscillospiraceae bacterium]
MKKKLMLFVVALMSVVCIFAISAGAATTNEFGTLETLDGIDLTGMANDTTSRVVLYDGSEYHTYPSSYIVKDAATFTLDFSKLNAVATYKKYDKSKIIRLEIPKGVTTLPKETASFRNQKNIVEIVLGNDVTTVNYRAFEYCSNLTTVTIGDKVTYFDNEVFTNNPIESIYISNINNWFGITFNGTKYGNPLQIEGAKLYANGTLVEHITLNVAEVQKYAFYGYDYLKSVTIPAGSTIKFNTNCFYGCDNMEKVIVSSIEHWASNSITFSGVDASPLIYANNLYVGDKLVTSLVVDEAFVSNIGGKSYAFAGASCITELTISEGVTTVPKGTFYGLGIKEITIPSTMTKLAESMFENCTSLVITTFQPHITYIGSYAFAGCSSITQFTIPSNYTQNFFGNGVLARTGIKEIVIPEKMTEIKGNTFQGCVNLEKVVFHSGVKTINGYAFDGCSALVEMNLVDTKITNLGGSAFAGCSSLVTVQFPTTLTGLTNGNAFRDCTSLQFVDFGDNQNSFSMSTHFTFYNCSSLQAISLPANTTKIGNGSFGKCTSLKAVYLGEALIEITGNKSDSSGDAPTFVNCVNMYFVNEPFSVINEDGDFYTPETFVVPEKPDVYYFPETLQIICGTHNRNSNHSMTADGHVTSYSNDDLAFVGCTNLNKYLVLPEGFTGFDDISNTRNPDQRGDTLPAGLFHGCGTAENPITIVFLGKIDRISFQRDQGNTNYVTYMFANEANTGFDDTTIGTWYNTSNANYRNQVEMYVIFCHAEGGAQKYLINFEGSASDNKMPVLKATLQEGLNAKDLHVSSPDAAVLTKEATCIANAYGNRFCFCGYELGEAEVEGTATGKHIFEKDNDCTTEHKCTSDPNCTEKIIAMVHEIYETLVYESFLVNGEYRYGCSNVGCTVIDKEDTTKPIFVAGDGFSTKISANDGISGGYVVNLDELNEYNRVNAENKLNFGVMMVNPKYLDGKESFFLGGKVNAEKCLQVDMSESRYTNLNITITGFVGDAREVSLVIALYAYVDGEAVEFIQSQTTQCADEKVTLGNDTLYTVTYESVATPAGKDLSNLGDYVMPSQKEQQ